MTMATIPVLLARLIDDAAVFPPGNLPLAEAVAAHTAYRDAWYADLVGPFLCPASRLDALGGIVEDHTGHLAVTVVADTGTGGVLSATDVVARDDRLVLRGVELPLRGEPLADNARRAVAALDAALGGPDDDEPAYVEIPRAPGWQGALDVVAEAGYRAKLRTGGADAAAIPSAHDLAAFVIACLDRGVAFKLTAGLHGAVRHRAADVTGDATEHGFLNVIAGVAAALDGGDEAAVAAILEDRDAPRVAATVGALPPERAAGVRRWFTSFGSCSIAEPLADLVGLGLLAGPERDR
jgi:hypothetical protein